MGGDVFLLVATPEIWRWGVSWVMWCGEQKDSGSVFNDLQGPSSESEGVEKGRIFRRILKQQPKISQFCSAFIYFYLNQLSLRNHRPYA